MTTSTCQVPGCDALAPWAYELDFGALVIAVFLCRRHERDFAHDVERPSALARQLAARQLERFADA